MPRNLAVGVLRGVAKVPRQSPASKYGTRPRPGRRLSKALSPGLPVVSIGVPLVASTNAVPDDDIVPKTVAPTVGAG